MHLVTRGLVHDERQRLRQDKLFDAMYLGQC